MTAAYTELQHAFKRMDNRFYDFRVQCRGLAQALREDLATYLGMSAGDVRFFKSEDLDAMNIAGLNEIPTQYNDPFEGGELALGGSYRIGLCFGIIPFGETTPAWYPLIPLRFTKDNGNFTLAIEKSDKSFDLGIIPEKGVRQVSEWIINRWGEIANEGFDNFVSGKANNEMGFHTLFSERRT